MSDAPRQAPNGKQIGEKAGAMGNPKFRPGDRAQCAVRAGLESFDIGCRWM
jgi:hypothetical protein